LSNTGATLFFANTSGVDIANSIGATAITSDKILSIANTKISGTITQSQFANGTFATSGTNLAVHANGVTNFKILGQIATTANTLSNVYVVPSATSATIHSLTICNQNPLSINIDIAVRPSTEVLATKHYILKNLNIPAADTYVLEPGIMLAANTVIAANTIGGNAGSGATGVSVHVYGVEIV
jgi:hypothetical protein